MKTKFLPILFFFILFCVKMTQAQTSFSVSDTLQDVYKNTTFGTVHGYVQLTNLTQSDLNLRWRLTITGKYPSSWVFSAADPDSSYSPVQTGDSADFVLDLVSSTTNKIIYGLDHNAEPGSAQMHFYIFDPANPSENVTVHFNLYILDASGIYNIMNNEDYELINEYLKIKNAKNISRIRIVSLNGTIIFDDEISEDKSILLPQKHAIYFIEIVKKSNTKSIIKYLNN